MMMARDPVALIRAARPRPPCRRPLVTVTFAQSLDGSIAVRRGERLVLSGPETKHLTHRLRAAHDAILVGINTVLADDPRLTARLVGGPHPRPVVLDSRLRMPAQARLWAHPQGVILATGPDAPPQRVEALTARGAQVLTLPRRADGLDLEALLVALAEHGLCSLMVEGGARVLASFLRHRLADWLVLTITPHLIGGVPSLAAPPLPDPAPPSEAARFPALEAWHTAVMGRDLVVWGRIQWPQ